MDRIDILVAGRAIAERLQNEGRSSRLARVDFDGVRCAVAGYLVGLNAGTGALATNQQIEDLENLTLRKFVEACA